MKSIYTSVFALALGSVSPNLSATSLPSFPKTESTRPSVDHQKVCETQAEILVQTLLPQMRLRAEAIIAGKVESIGLSLLPSTKFPNQYVQTQVIKYLDGEKEVTDLGDAEIDFPNPFLDFNLTYRTIGEFSLHANCKYPIKK